MNQQEKQYVVCFPVCEQNQCKHAFLSPSPPPPNK